MIRFNHALNTLAGPRSTRRRAAFCLLVLPLLWCSAPLADSMRTVHGFMSPDSLRRKSVEPQMGPITPYDRSIWSLSQEYHVDPLLLKAIISVESSFNPRCVSPKGARGLMQLMPATARLLGVRDIFDPADNIRAGARHFHYLYGRFSGNLPLTLAAYNAGEKPVLECRGVPSYPETQAYVQQVMQLYRAYKLHRGDSLLTRNPHTLVKSV